MITRILARHVPHLWPFSPPPGGPAGARRGRFEIKNPRFNLHNVKAAVFDIDGTLYALAGGPFVARYMALSKKYLPPGRHAAFQAEWRKALTGQSVFRMGRVYDVTNRKVLVLDAQGNARQAFEPWGGGLSAASVKAHYPSPIRRDDPDYIFMDAGNWVLTALARSFGIGYEDNQKVFGQLYREISQKPEQFLPSPDRTLVRFFSGLKQKGIKIAVMSNTPDPAASDILKGLGVEKYVDLFIPNAGKPAGSVDNLQKILQTFHAEPGEVLCTGDSVKNDLEIPHRLGMRTVLIEDFPVDPHLAVDAKCPSIHMLAQAFETTWAHSESSYKTALVHAAEDLLKFHPATPFHRQFMQEIRAIRPQNPDETRVRVSRWVNPLVDATRSPLVGREERNAAIRLYNLLIESRIEPSGDRPPLGEIANWQRVSRNLTRGSQPTEEGFAWLAATGHKGVLTLRHEDPSDIGIEKWPKIKKFTHIIKDEGLPTFKAVEEFLALVDNPENAPVFIHCRAGAGRTGLLAACYRIARQGWRAKEALEEAASFDIRGDLPENQKQFVRDFETYWKKKKKS